MWTDLVAKAKAWLNNLATKVETKLASLKIELVDGWTKWYKFWSIRFYAIIAILPDIWNLLDSSGILHGTEVSEQFSLMVKLIALAGAVSRLVKQKVADAVSSQSVSK